jgi:hypothetical protein
MNIRDLPAVTQRLLGFHLSEGVGGAFCRSLRYQEVGRFGERLKGSLDPTAHI